MLGGGAILQNSIHLLGLRNSTPQGATAQYTLREGQAVGIWLREASPPEGARTDSTQTKGKGQGRAEQPGILTKAWTTP